MLNYIWAGLILFSLVFALFYDLRDLSQDTFRNGQALPVEIDFEDRAFDPDLDRQPVTLRIDPAAFAAFYGTDATPDSAYAAQLRTTDDGLEVRLEPDAALPAPLDQIRDLTNPRDKALQGALVGGTVAAGATVATGGLAFASVRFVKMQAISAAALDFAEVAAEIALGLIGILVLFLGLTRIAEDAGIINALVKLVRPFLKPLFPDIPDGHPAMGMIALNLAANVFGLGNAATPFGIKAMEELQKINPETETATDSMVMLLAMNTASVQLVPPVLLIAIIGLEINKVYFAIVLTTTASLTVAIIATKLLGRLKRYRDTDPMRLAPSAPVLPPDASSSDADSEVR